jgi:hypothetical protein
MPQHGHFIPSSFRERPSLVPPARIDPLGVVGPTPGQARGPQWRRSSRGLYVPSYVDATVVEQRILEAAAVLPPVGGVTGWAGLRWMGGEWFDGLDPRGPGHLPVDLATCYQDIRTQAGFVVHQERLGPSELVRYDGLTCTSAVRSLCFLMRYARSLREATSFADLAAYSDLVSIAEATDYFLAHPGWTGIPQARDALALADENSWSRWETWMRLVWELDAGFPRPLCNRPVFDLDGNHIATPDLLDVESGTAGEYDGAVHLQGAQRSRDAERENRLRNVGLEPFVAFASDLPRPERAIRRMADARNRARWEPESRRRWTIKPPPWWIPTHTVEQRRQLNTSQRARLLRRRAA